MTDDVRYARALLVAGRWWKVKPGTLDLVDAAPFCGELEVYPVGIGTHAGDPFARFTTDETESATIAVRLSSIDAIDITETSTP